jgi:hypothetical protein
LNYAVPLEFLKKILQRQPAFRLPLTARESISILIDGKVAVPLLDLGRGVGSAQRGELEPGYQAVLESRQGPLALMSDIPGRITSKGERLPGVDADPSWVSGNYRYLDVVYAILNIDGLAMEMAGRLESRSMPQG